MKAKQRLFGFAVLFTAAMFSLIGCDTGLSGGDTPLTGKVRITGIPKVGESLTADISALNGSGGFAYQWSRGTAPSAVSDPIVGANGGTYTPTAEDSKKYLAVTVTRADTSGSITSGARMIASENAQVVTPAPGETVTDALTRVLSDATGGGTATEPVEVILVGIDFSDQDGGTDILSDLLESTALDETYVSLDFSGCIGASIENTTNGTLWSRVYKPYVVSVTLPDTLTTIGENAFNSFTNLVSVVFPDDLVVIGKNALANCRNLALTSLPAGLTTIGEGAFSSCRELALTSLPAGVTSIGDGAFLSCRNLALTSLPAGVRTIGSNAFMSSGIAQMTLPASVESIGFMAFFLCQNLTELTCLAPTPPTLGDNAFLSTPASLVIKVPRDSAVAYRAAPGWSAYADKIVAR